MDRASISGKMAGNMKAGTIMIRSMVKASITGQMGRYLRGNGFMARDKVKVDFPI